MGGLPVRYVSGLVAHHQAQTWPGDARDATVIAHTLRTHPDLPQLREPDPLVAELRVLVRRCRIRNATATLVRQLAGDVLALDKRLDALDVKIGRVTGRHPLTPILTSLPGMGVLLALARRRVDMLWAMVRDRTVYQPSPPTVI